MIINPIGVIRSPYSEKFGVPRQPNLVTAGEGELHLIAPYNQIDSVRGLEQFSHLWLIFLFNQTMQKGWQPTVRPPRLGGNKKMGVFASRSTFRPNPIGLSAVTLKEVITKRQQVILKLGSLDLIDGTPIVDIKPYIPYCDSYPDAIAGYAQQAPQESLEVVFSSMAEEQLYLEPSLKTLIKQVIEQDPRPAYKKNNSQRQEYGIRLYEFNVRWQVSDNHAVVLRLEKVMS